MEITLLKKEKIDETKEIKANTTLKINKRLLHITVFSLHYIFY